MTPTQKMQEALKELLRALNANRPAVIAANKEYDKEFRK